MEAVGASWGNINRTNALFSSLRPEEVFPGVSPLDVSEFLASRLSENLAVKSARSPGRKRTQQETFAEYEVSKWGKLLQSVESNTSEISIDKLDEIFMGTENVAFSVTGKLFQGPAVTARRVSNKMVFSYLDSWQPFRHLTELGAGYGSVLLGYQKSRFGGPTEMFVGTDFSRSAVHLIKSAGAPSLTSSFTFDFDSVGEQTLPSDSVIISHMALMMIPNLKREVFDRIVEARPKLVINFESVVQDFPADQLGDLQRDYTRINGYNHNLLEQLKLLESEGSIEIVDHIPCLFAENALLPTSVLAWKPKQLS